jgi:hypothetical protein
MPGQHSAVDAQVSPSERQQTLFTHVIWNRLPAVWQQSVS